MNTIYAVDAHGYWTGGARQIAADEGCPPGWVRASAPNPPSEKVAIINGTGWRYVSETPPPPTVPARAHKYWLIKVLEALGVMDDIENAMDAAWDAGNRSLKRDWLAATEIERANPLVNSFASDRGYTSEQVDDMFIQAVARQTAEQTAEVTAP